MKEEELVELRLKSSSDEPGKIVEKNGKEDDRGDKGYGNINFKLDLEVRMFCKCRRDAQLRPVFYQRPYQKIRVQGENLLMVLLV